MATDTIRIIYGRAAVGTLTADIYPVGSLTALATGATVSTTAATGVYTFPAVTPTAGTTYSYHLKDSGVSGQLVAYGFFVALNDGSTIEELDIHSPLRPTVSQRTLDVSSTGEAGIDWANVGSASTTLNLSGTTVKAVTDAITLPTLPTDWITADGLSAGAVTEIQSGLSTLNAAGVRTAIGLAAADLDDQLAALPTALEIADAVWDEATSGHQTAGTFGKQVDTIEGHALIARYGGVVLIGSISNAGTATESYTYGGTTLTFSGLDEDGNRSGVVVS